MNINLISPNDNGHTYNVRFKEELIVPANSKVYLNHTSLSREGNIVFFENQELSLHHNQTDILPQVTLNPNGSTKNIGLNEAPVIIPAGSYSYEALFTLISGELDKMLKPNNLVFPTGEVFRELYRAVGIADIEKRLKNQQNDQNDELDFAIGLMKAQSLNHSDDAYDDINSVDKTRQNFAIHPTHNRNAGTTDGVDTNLAYIKTNGNNVDAGGNKIFDNYALSEQKLWFGNYDDATPFESAGVAVFESRKTITEMLAGNSSIQFGLYGEDVADGTFGSNGNWSEGTPNDSASRTSGGSNLAPNGSSHNPKNLPNISVTQSHNLAMWFNVSIDCRGATPFLIIRKAQSSSTDRNSTYNTWKASNKPIAQMRQAKKTRLTEANGFEADDKVTLGLQLFFKHVDNTGGGSSVTDAVFVRVIDMNKIVDVKLPIPSDAVIYSDQILRGFTPLFMVTKLAPLATDDNSVSDAVRLRRIKSQTPFNIMVGADTQNDGFERITLNSLNPDGSMNDATHPSSILKRYRITATEELANYFNIPQSTDPVLDSHTLFPNTGDVLNSDLFHAEGINIDWKNESYSIYLKGLPIKNYKNNDKTRSGGFSKAILSNVPVPFQGASTPSGYSLSDKNLITAVYEPNYQTTSNLYNQETTINQIGVEIRHMRNDRPANELKKSNVSFTIVPPDDYKENINSVENKV
jgi:hypothetical protein